MGIGFGVTAKIPAPGGKIMPRATLFAAITKAVEDSCDDPFLASLISFGEHEHELAVVLHPAAEAVFFVWDPDGTVSASSKTSTVGPGYHAYAIDVVRAVGQRVGINWDWSDDETGYATRGDFADLQKQMAEFLRILANAFLKDDKLRDTSIAVNMAPGAPVAAEGGPWSITPIGPRGRSFWEALARGENLTQHAREFYPWWNRERDASYYHKTGQTLLWTEINWRPPKDEAEESAMRLAIDCFERAAEMNPKLPIPEKEIAELKQLLDLGEEDPFPGLDPSLMGYFRKVIHRPLPGPWKIALPGWWPEEFDEQSGVLYIGIGSLGVHVTVHTITGPGPEGKAPTAENLAKPDKEDVPKGAKPVRIRRNDQVGYYWIYHHQDEDPDETGWVLAGFMAVDGCVANITCWLGQTQNSDWAIKAFSSVEFVKEGDA